MILDYDNWTEDEGTDDTYDEDDWKPSYMKNKEKFPDMKFVEKSLAKKKKISKKGMSSPSIGAYQCRICENKYDKPSNLKNHVLNHFKDQLLLDLPTSLPFTCPECKNIYRDKITLLRHYAFGHRKVFDFATEEDFKARPKQKQSFQLK